MICSVIRWLDYLFNVWSLATMKFAQRHKKLPKKVQNFAEPTQNFQNSRPSVKMVQIWSHLNEFCLRERDKMREGKKERKREREREKERERRIIRERERERRIIRERGF